MELDDRETVVEFVETAQVLEQIQANSKDFRDGFLADTQQRLTKQDRICEKDLREIRSQLTKYKAVVMQTINEIIRKQLAIQFVETAQILSVKEKQEREFARLQELNKDIESVEKINDHTYLTTKDEIVEIRKFAEENHLSELK